MQHAAPLHALEKKPQKTRLLILRPRRCSAGANRSVGDLLAMLLLFHVLLQGLYSFQRASGFLHKKKKRKDRNMSLY